MRKEKPGSTVVDEIFLKLERRMSRNPMVLYRTLDLWLCMPDEILDASILAWSYRCILLRSDNVRQGLTTCLMALQRCYGQRIRSCSDELKYKPGDLLDCFTESAHGN